MATIKLEIAPLGTAENSNDWKDLVPYIAYNGLKWQRNDIDASDSGRDTMDGLMHRDRVAQKDRFDCTLRPLTYDELHMILGWVQPQSFLVRVTDLISGTSTTNVMYSNNIPATFILQRGDTQYWSGVQIPLIEM